MTDKKLAPKIIKKLFNIKEELCRITKDYTDIAPDWKLDTLEMLNDLIDLAVLDNFEEHYGDFAKEVVLCDELEGIRDTLEIPEEISYVNNVFNIIVDDLNELIEDLESTDLTGEHDNDGTK